ncbi:MAG TPA: T9SS type A sorting domain-containing protein [Flavipsychrobacter sp.]|nr:T9SS type A sorting domain-containing protein [Flavipsychrobacter sp.]
MGTASANDLAIITDVKAGSYKASIVDLTGKVVFTQDLNCKTGKQAITIAGFHLSNGMYLLNLSNGKEQGTAKFIVE